MTVSQVVNTARMVIETHTQVVWVEGEVDSLSRASSGHVYFALKDDQCQMRAVMWRSDAQRLRFRLDNGQTLRCRGRANIYARDGKFQFYVQYAEPVGLGAEALALEQRKRKLAAEGLFDPARKRALPLLPRRIGVVTSRSGAAVRDIIRTVQRRFPVPILVADAAVQGAGAPMEIVRALRDIACTDVDVIIVGRGGGAASDLAAFNDEAVVRAIAACPVPVISAVGHEIDYSLADLAADLRAATPTAAGEVAVPVLADLAALLAKEEQRLHREMRRRIQDARQELDLHLDRAGRSVERRLSEGRHQLVDLRRRLEACHPRVQLAGIRGQVNELRSRLDRSMAVALSARRHRLTELRARLDPRHLQARVKGERTRLQELEGRLDRAMQQRLERGRRDLGMLAAQLRSLSPLQVLERGYAIARGPGGVVTAADQVAAGDPLTVHLARGSLDCRVETVHLQPTQPAAGAEAAAAAGADAAAGNAPAPGEGERP